MSRSLERDIQHGYAEIQQRVDSEFARSTELAEKAEELEGKVAELEGQRRTLQEEVESLREARTVLEAELLTERSVLSAAAQASWEALDRMEGAMSELGAVPPPRKHTADQLPATLDRLRRAGEVFLPAARAYGNHCAKAAWTAAFVSLQRGGCGHVDALGGGTLPVASAADVTSGQKQVRRASNALAKEFWAPSGRDATMESLRASLALKLKLKAPAEAPTAAERRAGPGDKV